MDFVDKVKLAKVSDCILIRCLVERDGQYRFLLVELLSDTHSRDVDFVLAQHRAKMADNAGTVFVEDNDDRALRSYLGVEAVDFDDAQQLFAEDRAGNGASNFVGDNLRGKTGSDVFGRRVFGFVDTDAAFLREDRRIDQIQRHFKMLLQQADGEIERYGLERHFGDSAAILDLDLFDLSRRDSAEHDADSTGKLGILENQRRNSPGSRRSVEGVPDGIAAQRVHQYLSGFDRDFDLGLFGACAEVRGNEAIGDNP